MGLFDFFKKSKKQETVETSGFQFYGDGKHLKSDEEMKSIDGVAADTAFKKCKKEILDVYLKSKGFSLYKTSNYVRLNNIGLVEYINLQKEAHGSRTFCVNFCLFPLYVPHPFITIGYGDRVGTYISGHDFWWSYHDMSAAEKSFENVVAAIDQYIMLWFEEHSNEDIYYNELVTKKYQLGNSHIEWAIHKFIRNNDIAEAKQFLANIKSEPQYEYMISRIRGDVDERIAEMQDLLEPIQDSKQYIADVVHHNVETHKFPASFIKQMEG